MKAPPLRNVISNRYFVSETSSEISTHSRRNIMDNKEFQPHWHQPSHPDRLLVTKGKPFAAKAISLISLPAGSHFAHIVTATKAAQKTYATVQTSSTSSIELNSDLVYCNHSCQPSLVFDMEKFQVRVADDRPIEIGDELTFFYPSTEWDMVQPFRCICAAPEGVCHGWISGARDMDRAGLTRYWLNRHVHEQLVESEARDSRSLDLTSEAKPVSI